GGVVLNFPQGDETAALDRSSAVRRRKALDIVVQRGFVVLPQNMRLAPLLKMFGGAGINVTMVTIPGLRSSQDDANQVIRARVMVLLLHLRSDLVVGLGNNLRHGYPGRVVTERPKWLNVGQDGVEE